MQNISNDYVEKVLLLTDSFEAIYDVNLDTGEYSVSNKSGVLSEKIQNRIEMYPDFYESTIMAINMSVYAEDQAMMLHKLSKENIISKLNQFPEYTIDYRVASNNGPIWYRIKLVRGENWPNEKRMLEGIFYNDDYMKAVIQKEMFEEMYLAFSGSFDTVYYINTDDNSYQEITRQDFYEEIDVNVDKEDFFRSSYHALKKVANPDDLDAVLIFLEKKRLLRALADGKRESIEYRLNVKGEDVYYRMRAIRSVYSENHIIISTENVNDEVIKRNSMQSQIESSMKESEEARDAKNILLSNLSRNIRTPLGSIMGSISLAKNHFEDKYRLMKCFENIELSGQRLLALTNQIVDMVNVERIKDSSVSNPVDLVERGYSMLALLDDKARDKGVTISFAEKNITDPYVYADESVLSRIMLNLLGNSLKYTNEGGSVVFSFEQCKTEKEGFGRYILRVEDTGIGMSEEFLARAFEPFAVEKCEENSESEGIGLGLLIVKQLVDFMDGSIDIKSKPNQGTTVEVTMDLKLADDQEYTDWSLMQEDSSEAENLEMYKNVRILLAEDNDMNAEITGDILGDYGFMYERAEDGDVAIDMLEKSESGYYDIILMDVHMPRMDGYIATQNIRKMADTVKANIPIIAMTANNTADAQRKSLAAGMNVHVSKPLDYDMLVKTIANLLSENKKDF